MSNNDATFEQLVIEALDELPLDLRRYLENVEVLVAERPTPEQRRALGAKPWHTIYGMYEGVPLTQRSNNLLMLPDVVTIFQQPLERDFPQRTLLKAEVRRTVLHEIAHVFGISDERLRELDAY